MTANVVSGVAPPSAPQLPSTLLLPSTPLLPSMALPLSVALRLSKTLLLRRAFGGLAAVLVMAGSSASCTMPDVVAEGEPAPAFAGVDLDGRNVELRELRGEVVLLNVWATWCYPCRREMPALEELHREWGDRGLRIVAISIDAASASRDVRDFVKEYDLTFDVVHDGAQQVTRAYATIGVPETFLIGADGRLVKRWMGRIDPRSENIRGPVREALRRRG